MNNLNDITNAVVAMFKEYEKTGTNPWNHRVAAFDLSYQVGSLAKRVAQLHNDRYREGMDDEQIKVLIADELADIIAESLFIAHDFGIDMEQAFANMFKSDEKKIEARSS